MEQSDDRNKCDPSMHSFSIQNQSLFPPHKKYQPLPNKKMFNKRIFKSEVKITKTENSTHRYEPIKLVNTQQSNHIMLNKSSANFIQRHDTQNSIAILQNSPDRENQRYNEGKGEEFRKTLKITNLNKSFYYNLKEKRSKKFSYRESPEKYFKKFSRKLQEKADAPKNEASNQWRFKSEHSKSKPVSVRQSANQQKSNTSKNHQKLNFLDFLIDYNKKQRIANSLGKKEGIEATLARLGQVPRPEMLKMPLKAETQR